MPEKRTGLLIDLHGDDHGNPLVRVAYQYFGSRMLFRGRVSPNSNILVLPQKQINQLGDAIPEFVLDAAIKQSKENGPLQDLFLWNHASPMEMTHLGRTDDFLDKLAKAQQKEGKPITKRIVFAGCNTLDMHELAKKQSLSPESIDSVIGKLRDYAVKHQVEIVGTTTVFSRTNVGWIYGRWVAFTPDGKIKRDTLDRPDLFQMAVRKAYPDPNDSWVHKHTSTNPQVSTETDWVDGYVARHPDAKPPVNPNLTNNAKDNTRAI